MKKTLVIIFFLIGISYSFAQEATYEKVKKQFESFEYENVIKFSEQLVHTGNLSDSLLIDIYRMRAHSFYGVGNEQAARQSYISILKIRRKYNVDVSLTPPKLVDLFNEVKSEFLKKNPEQITPEDSTKHAQEIKKLEPLEMKMATIKNLILPGLGQLHFGNSAKGWITTTMATANLGAMIYFIFDSQKKENDYLKESNKLSIPQKYDSYNSSFKIRNTLIISYALIWIYSQLDLLLSDNEPQANISTPISTRLEPGGQLESFRLSFSFHF